jgi:hypothetical protein
LGPRPAALFTNSASLGGLIFLVALLNIESTERQIELTVKAGDHSEYDIKYNRRGLTDI